MNKEDGRFYLKDCNSPEQKLRKELVENLIETISCHEEKNKFLFSREEIIKSHIESCFCFFI